MLYLKLSLIFLIDVCLMQESERQKHMCGVLQHKVDELKEGIRQRDELIEVYVHACQIAKCSYKYSHIPT